MDLDLFINNTFTNADFKSPYISELLSSSLAYQEEKLIPIFSKELTKE